MADKLTVRFNDRKIDELLVKRDTLNIGRKVDNDIRLEDITVSSHHARLQNQHDGLYIEDLGSTNGTYVNGDPIRKKRLASGDVILIGKYTIRFEQIEPEPLSVELDPTLQLNQHELEAFVQRFQRKGTAGGSTTSDKTLNWIAQDENGVWWGFQNKPIAGIHGWMDEDEGLKVLLKQERQGNVNWKDTLRKL
jgi:pSer/pThr/pTyr-binding forkhead associated (FHA) protein